MQEKYTVTITGFNSTLNSLLENQIKRWDSRLKKLIVTNPEKAKNDRLCEKFIRQQLKGVHIDKPVWIKYSFYVPNKKQDRSNTAAALIKSFEDALQHCKVVRNDCYDLMLTYELYFEVDRKNPRIVCEINVVDEKEKDKEC